MSKKTKRRILSFVFINSIHIHFYIGKFFVSSNKTIATSFSTTSWKFSTTSNAVAFFTDMTSWFHYFFIILQYFNIVQIKYCMIYSVNYEYHTLLSFSFYSRLSNVASSYKILSNFIIFLFVF